MDNVKFLTELNMQDIVGYIVDDTGAEYDEALDSFCGSETFRKLCDGDTGLYRESAGYIYELYKIEKKNKKFLQTEQ